MSQDETTADENTHPLRLCASYFLHRLVGIEI